MTIGFATWTHTIAARTNAPNATDAIASPRLSRSGAGSVRQVVGRPWAARCRDVARPGPLGDREHRA